MADADVKLVFGVDEASYGGTNLGGLRTYLDNLSNTVYHIRIDANMSEAYARVNEFKSNLGNMTMNITLDQNDMNALNTLVGSVNTLDVSRLTTMRDIFNDLRINPQAAQSIRELNEALNIIAQNPVLQEGLLQRAQDALDLTGTPTVPALENIHRQILQIIDSAGGLNSAGNQVLTDLRDRAEALGQALVDLDHNARATGEEIRTALSNNGLDTNLAMVNETRNMMTAARDIVATESNKIVLDLMNMQNQIQNELSRTKLPDNDPYVVRLRADLEGITEVLNDVRNNGVSAGQALINAFTGVDHPIAAIKEHIKDASNQSTALKDAMKAVDNYYKAATKVIGVEGLTRGQNGWEAIDRANQAMVAQANVLNTLEGTMNGYVNSTNNAGMSQVAFTQLLQHQTIALGEYNRAAEEAATKSRFDELLGLQDKIGSLQYKIAELDPKLDARQIEDYNAKLAIAQQRFNDLQNEILAMRNTTQLTSEETKKLADNAQKWQDKLDHLNASKFDEQRNAVNDLLTSLKDIEKVNPNAPGLKDFIAEVETFKSAMDTMTPEQIASKIEELGNKFNELGFNAKSGTTEATAGVQSLQNRMVYMLSAAQILRKVWQEIKELIKMVKELDTAMTQLKVVTDNTSDEYRKYASDIAQVAQQIGASTKDLIDSTTVFARLGYNLEESSMLSKYTSMLQNVGAIDVSSAQDAVTAITKAFGVGANDIEDVMDKMVIVGNNFPISVSQIAEGMNNAGSSMAAAGNSLEESIALLTAANTTVQNVSKASTALRTLTARIRKTDVDLDELGETIETANYEEVINNLTKHNVLLTEANGEYRSTYEIMQDIAAIWDELTSMEQAAVAQQLAGTRQQNIFYSIVEQFQEAENAMATMEGSVGALNTAYDKYMDSITAKTGQFKAAKQELADNAFSGAVLGGFVDSGTAVIHVLSQLIGLFKDLGGALPAVTGVIASLVASSLPKIIQSYKTFAIAMTSASQSATGFTRVLATHPGVVGAVVAGLTVAISVYQRIKQHMEELRREAAQAASDFEASVNKSRSSFEDYAKRISDLKTKLNDSTLSHQELYDAQAQILSIRGELVETYGEQAEAIDWIGISAENARNELVRLQREYERTEASKYLTEIGDQGDRAVRKMEEDRLWARLEIDNTNSAVINRLKEIAGKYESAIWSYDDLNAVAKIEVVANARDAEETIYGLGEDIRALEREFSDVDIGKMFRGGTDLSESLSKVQKVIDDFGNIYDKVILSKIAETDEYADVMGAYRDAVKEYDDAVNGVYDSAEERGKAIADALAKINAAALLFDDTDFSSDPSVQKYLAELFDALMEQSKKERLRVQFELDFDNGTMGPKARKGLTDIRNFIVDQLKLFSEDGTQASIMDILLAGETAESKGRNSTELSEKEEAYYELAYAANVYGMSVEEMLHILSEEGIVIDDITKSIDDQNSALKMMSMEEMNAATQSAIQVQNGLGESFIQNTRMSKDLYESLVSLVGGEEALSAAVDKDRGYLIKNVDALNELIASSQDALANNIAYGKSFSQSRYHELTKQLYNLVGATDAYDESLRDEIDSTLNDLNNTRLQIEQYRLLEQQLLGVANGFERLNNAKAIDEAADYTDELSGAFDDLVNSFEKHEFGTETFKEAFDTLIPEDVYGQFVDLEEQYEAGWDYLTGTLSKYITKGDKGSTEVTFENAKNFIQAGLNQSLGDGLGNVFEGSLEDFTLNPQIQTLEQFADEMNVTTEVAFALATAISKYMIGNEDFLDNFDLESFDAKVMKADKDLTDLLEQRDRMKRAGSITGSEWDELNSKIAEAKQNLKELQDQARQKVSARIEIDEEYKEYLDEVNKANEAGADLTRTTYGNIDLTNRQVTQWTESSVAELRSVIDTWNNLNPEDLIGEISTVLGGWDNFNDGKGINLDIAFSPILQTENGPKLLDSRTVSEYIWYLIDEAKRRNGGNVTAEDIIELDVGLKPTEGFYSDGLQVKGLIADIGEEAEHTAEVMHFAGPDGSVAQKFGELKTAADEAGLSIEELDATPIEIQLTIESIDDDIANIKAQLASATDPAAVDALNAKLKELEQEKADIQIVFGLENEDDVTNAVESLIELEDEAGKDRRFKIIFENYTTAMGLVRDYINLLSQVGNTSYTVSTGYAKATRSGRNQVMYTGTAHNSGNWGLPSSERDALLGELGAELVVDPRTGKYYTVGDRGAELVDLPKGAIIFNHKQTEELLKNGKIDTRGRALAEGNAHAGVGSATFNMKKFDYATAVAAAVGSAATSATASVAKEIAEEVKDVAEAVDELDDELKETLENMKKEMDEIIGNYEHSIFLLEKTGGSAESQIAIYEEMMKAVNDQANKYRNLGLDDNNDYIQDLQKQWWDYHDKIIDLNADMYDKIIDAHENSMSLREHWIEDAYARGDKAEAQRLQEEQIAEYEAVQRELHEKAEYYRSLGYKETDDEISELANKWWDYHDKINDIREDMFERMIQEHEDAVSVLENSVTLTENWLDNAESRGDRSGIIKYTNDIVNYYKEMQDEIHRQAEDYRARGYSDLSDEVSALSDKWWEYQRNITDAMSSAFEQIVSEAHNSLDEIQGVYDTLIKASEEYAENGFITVDTFQEIAKMGVQYMSLLRNQNGELVISEQNINAIIAAKTRQLAVDTALDYVQKISTASKNNDITALKNLINATSLATTTTWDLVYAQLYAAGLSGDDYAAARRNIDNMRLLAENAVAGIGQVATTASNATSSASGKANKALQEQKEALDDILKYVKEMIKQEIKDQVDALKEQQKAYKEIVDLQKKSLDLEKEKDTYTKDVKDKTNEIAKLQQKIYMLDLDNSREAQAEKAKLQEDLAKMQGDLADKQADKARDTTKDMLDDMAEAYSKEKDEEIKALEDSISSEEKLYQKAIERIRTGWDTLYDDLIKWNTQYGNVTNAEISDAWSKAQKAAEKYGDYLTALEAITARLAKESGNVGSGLSSGGSSYSGAGWGSNNGTPGKVGDSAAYIDTIKHLARRMKTNSDDWHTADVETRKALADDNLVLGKQIQAELRKFDPTAVVERDSNGVWYVTTNGKRMKLFGEFVPDVYHSGGIVGGFGTAKQDETFAKLQNGEMVLNDQQQKRMIRILDDSETIFTKMSSMFGLNSSSSPLTRLRDMFTGNEIQAAFAGGDNVTITVAPEINVSVASASDQAEVRRLSKQISDNTIDSILDAFAKRGKRYGSIALLKS